MKLELNKFQVKINPKDLVKKIRSFVIKRELLVLAMIAMALIAYCGYLWYGYNYNYQWDEVERQTYMNSKKSSVGFDKERFEEVLGDINARQEKYKEELKIEVDIFRLNK